MSKRNKNLSLSVACLLSGMFYFFAIGAASAELAPGTIQFDSDFTQQMNNFLDKQPPPGPFTGGETSGLREVLPFVYNPFTDFKLLFNATSNQSYQKGETIKLSGNIAYSSQRKDDFLKKIEKNCKDNTGSECPNIDFLYPVYNNLGIFAQIWRKDKTEEAKKGDYLVDQFYIAQDINLKEDQKQEFNLNWVIPREIKDGDYYVNFYVNANKKFNLLGSPTLFSSSKYIYNFSIAKKENSSDGVELDKNNIKINGESYVYRQSPPEIKQKDGQITIEVPIINLSSEEQEVAISYEVSGWSQIDPRDIVKTQKETLSIGANQKNIYQIKYQPSDISSVQNVNIEAVTSKSKSCSNISFVLVGRNRGILQFLGLAKPQINSDFIKPMFCVRNTQYSGYFDGKIKISFTDVTGKAKDWEKNGQIGPNQDRCFILEGDNFNFPIATTLKIKGEIFDDQGRVVDVTEVNYLGQSAGNSGYSTSAISERISNIWGDRKNIALLIIALIVVISGFLIYLRKKQSNESLQ